MIDDKKIEHWPALLCVLDLQHRFKQVNDRWSRLGISSQVLLTSTFIHWIHPDDVMVCKDLLAHLQEEEVKQVTFETRWRNAKGEFVWLLWSATKVSTEWIYVVGLEATEYRTQEQYYRAIVNNLPEGILMYDAQGKIQICNRGAEQLLGVPAYDLIGHSEWPGTMITADGEPLLAESHPVGLTLRAEKPCHEHILGLKTQDRLTWLAINTQPLRIHEAATTDAVVVSLRDISEYQHQITELRDKLDLLATLFDSTSLGMAILNEDGRFVRVNTVYSQCYGYQPSELLGQPFTILLPPPIRKEAALCYSDFFANHTAQDERWPLQHREGQWLSLPTVESKFTLSNHQSFKVTWVIPPTVLALDETNATKSPWQSAWLASLFKQIPITVLGIDREGYLTLAYGPQLGLLGLADIQIGQSVFATTLNSADLSSDLERALTGETFSKLLTHSGVTLEAHFLTVTSGSDWLGNLVIFKDVSELRWLRARLKSVLQELELVTPHTFLGIMYVENQRIIRTNSVAATLLGYSEAELLKLTLSSLFRSSNDYQYLQTQVESSLAQLTPYCSQHRFRKKNGTFIHCKLTVKSLMAMRTLWLLEEFSELTQSGNGMNLQTALWMTSTEAILITDSNLRILQANPTCTLLTGYSVDELINLSLPQLSSGREEAQFYEKILMLMTQMGQWQGKVWLRQKNQAVSVCDLKLQIYQTEALPSIRYVAILSHQQTSATAFSDPLTNLPTSSVFRQILFRTHAIAQRHVKYFAILLVSLDELSSINTNFGGPVGDLFLQEIAQILRTSVRDSDAVARYGGNRFSISLEEIRKPQDVILVAQMVLFKASQSIILENQTISSPVSIGIVVYPEDGTEVDRLLELALVAMQRAKQHGGGQCCFHNTDLEHRYL